METIVVDDVSKRFRLYHEKLTSLKERVIHLGKVPYEEYWALKNVSLAVESGETFGFLGHNGSGKSTLLKCIAGIIQPTSGEIRTRGRLASMLELGAGFHPDLTGRENVYLNASLLGFSNKHIDSIFDDIVEFAELEQFIDNQVKFYSSGMYVRLGFAVAVNMDPEILLVDEVLAVGDELFQRKCLDRVKQFQKDGRTIVLVTHSADMVRQICDRAAVLDEGALVTIGTPPEAIRTYREHLIARQEQRELALEEAALLASLEDDSVSLLSHGERQEQKRTLEVKINDVHMDFEHSSERKYLLPGETLTIRVDYETDKPTSNVAFGIAVYDVEGRNLFGANTDVLGIDLGELNGKGSVSFRCDNLPLLDGDYSVTVGVHSHDELTVFDWQEQKYSFEILSPTKETGMVHVPISVSVQQSKVNNEISA
jgi:ABC-2 type transport system ATP-binding protein